MREGQLALPWPLHRHMPVKEIMRKGYWKSDTCFTSYYLKDIAKYTENPAGLNTIAAGFTLQF
jgi:hypothetical protein